MSTTQPTPIALQLPAVSGPPAGFATLFIQISNSDGSVPTLAPDPTAATTDVTILGQPVPNDGSNSQFPVEQFPYMAKITAQVAGEELIDLSADGIVCQQFDVTVTTASPETATVPDGAIVITPPG